MPYDVKRSYQITLYIRAKLRYISVPNSWFLPTKPCVLRSTRPLKMSTTDFSWRKGGRCVWLMTYHPCSACSGIPLLLLIIEGRARRQLYSDDITWYLSGGFFINHEITETIFNVGPVFVMPRLVYVILRTAENIYGYRARHPLRFYGT